MPTSTDANVAYVPRKYIPLNNNVTESSEAVKNVVVNVQQLTSVSTKAGLSTIAKVSIAVGTVSGITILVAACVTAGVLLSKSTATTVMSTISTTTTTATTTTVSAVVAPSNLVSYRSYVNQTFSFIVTGTTSGTIWGTTIYTDDSSLSTAAVHSGFITNGVTGTISTIILAGQSSYTSTTQNGITSNSYGSWIGSYQILSVTG